MFQYTQISVPSDILINTRLYRNYAPKQDGHGILVAYAELNGRCGWRMNLTPKPQNSTDKTSSTVTHLDTVFHLTLAHGAMQRSSRVCHPRDFLMCMCAFEGQCTTLGVILRNTVHFLCNSLLARLIIARLDSL